MAPYRGGIGCGADARLRANSGGRRRRHCGCRRLRVGRPPRGFPTRPAAPPTELASRLSVSRGTLVFGNHQYHRRKNDSLLRGLCHESSRVQNSLTFVSFTSLNLLNWKRRPWVAQPCGHPSITMLPISIRGRVAWIYRYIARPCGRVPHLQR